ncbi:MAG: 50S ribosomal protein L19 [Saprospiraceae bacterium]|jgi:large subunit ribosomal protein L19|nr:50S ribosomal protein L19 [Saprospiraceae bacterium]MBP7922434.1 50S ribosomal protein L19 [Saprospiraceae bacterium]MBP8096605.1 50S ribosomal protein L19 [Saprospiraceae bacterium]MBP8940739.1 50S ribosomal protein L19 [Saprospiraceae bacterium]MBP9746696.1 50S ribosomal protein L19 [Saprospiraceae bacterium]
MDAIQYIQQQLLKDRTQIDVKPGDNVNVSYKIIEGDKERIQNFKGDVIQISGSGLTKTICIRKISNGVGVERIFPLNSPNIVEIELLKKGKVRRAKLYYLRALSGKKARIKEKKLPVSTQSSDKVNS